MLVGAALAAVVLAGALTGCADDGGAGSDSAGPNATVVRVVDGDTIVARIDGVDERVRLIGIDSPESVKQDSPVECFGPEASAHLEEIIPAGTPVRLELDVEPRDRFDRLLAYVFRSGDDLFVNRAMVLDGYAAAFVYKPNVTYTSTLADAARTAKSNGTGLWAACRANPPFPR